MTSLVKHSALNATTLRVLKNCEMGTLSLAGCRGVTDEWLEPLSSRSSTASPQLSYQTPTDGGLESMDLDDFDCKKPPPDVFYNATSDGRTSLGEQIEDSSCSTSSFVSASSSPPVVHGDDHHLFYSSIRDRESVHSVTMEGLARHSLRSSSSQPVCSVTANITLLDLRGSQRLTDKGLMQLSDLSSLEVARLDNCHSIVGRGLLAFSSSHRLHTLSLANCRRLTDEAIINISHLTSLEALALDGCRCLTDRSLAAISSLYRLRKLDLSQCDLLTDDGLEELETLDALEEVSFGWCRTINDRGVDIFTSHAGRRESIKIFSLARCSISDSGIEYLGRLANLEELDLNGCSNIGSSALGKTLSHLTKLTNLDVSYCPGIL